MERKTYKHLVQDYDRLMDDLGEDACYEDALYILNDLARSNTYSKRGIKKLQLEIEEFWNGQDEEV